MSNNDPVWQLPIDTTHHLAASAGCLTFVGGAGDFDEHGGIRNPDHLYGQIAGTFRNLETALAVERCSLEDIMRLKVYYASDGSVDEWELAGALVDQLSSEPLPTLSLIPVVQQPFAGQALQVQAMAQRGWRSLADIRVDPLEIPSSCRRHFNVTTLSSGLRAGEIVCAASRTAEDLDGDGPAQSRLVMRSLEDTFHALGASLQDAVKMEGYYFGTEREHWVEMARTRGGYFRDPGPVATVVPCQLLWPVGAQTRIEVLGLRTVRGGFDKYIPRDDCWPERVWDWPIPLPYRQAVRLRDMIWLGGQVPAQPFHNGRERVLANDLAGQTAFTMSYVEDLLRGFDRHPHDLKLAVCYYRSDGNPETTQQFLATLRDCFGCALPPLTLVPQPHLHTPTSTVEIWGVAAA